METRRFNIKNFMVVKNYIKKTPIHFNAKNGTATRKNCLIEKVLTYTHNMSFRALTKYDK